LTSQSLGISGKLESLKDMHVLYRRCRTVTINVGSRLGLEFTVDGAGLSKSFNRGLKKWVFKKR
jgi:hypothetical protein